MTLIHFLQKSSVANIRDYRGDSPLSMNVSFRARCIAEEAFVIPEPYSLSWPKRESERDIQRERNGVRRLDGLYILHSMGQEMNFRLCLLLCSTQYWVRNDTCKMYMVGFTGVVKRVLPRLQECARQVEAEVVSNSSNKIHQTWEASFWQPL